MITLKDGTLIEILGKFEDGRILIAHVSDPIRVASISQEELKGDFEEVLSQVKIFPKKKFLDILRENGILNKMKGLDYDYYKGR